MNWIQMRRKPTSSGMTLVELLVTTMLSVLVIAILYSIWSSSIRQEQNLSRHISLQRGLRAAMALIQHDLRELVRVDRLERTAAGTVREFEFSKTDDGVLESVIYRMSGVPVSQEGDGLTEGELHPRPWEDESSGSTGPPASVAPPTIRHTQAELDQIRLVRSFLGRDQELLGDSLVDFKIFPFVENDPPIQVERIEDLVLIDFFRVKLSFLPGKDEFQNFADQRSISFTVYPRVPTSRRKSVYGRFKLKGGRFDAHGGPEPLLGR